MLGLRGHRWVPGGVPRLLGGASGPPDVCVPPLHAPQDAVKIMAKDLVRTRRYVKKFITMRANVQAVSLKIQTLKSNNSMAQAMKGVTKAMATMNRQVGACRGRPQALGWPPRGLRRWP